MNTPSIHHLAYVILPKSLLQSYQIIYICKITGVMIKDLLKVHINLMSLLVQKINNVHRNPPTGSYSKPINSSLLLHSVILCLMSMLFSPLRLDFSGRLPPSFSGQNFIYSFDLHDTFPSLAHSLTN